MRTVVIVGASLAGLRAAETLREEGYDGSLTMIGAETHLPYDRPPLSKQVLAGTWAPERTALTPVSGSLDELDAEWRLGVAATGLDLVARTVALANGEHVSYDGLVLSTGAAPRTLPGTDGIAGVHVLRTLDDCLALRAELDAGPQRVAVVGAGFIGAEVAATCRGRGLDVTLIEALAVPLGRVLGLELGHVFADLHHEHGVDLRLDTGVDGIDVADGRVSGVRLSDGTVVDAEVVVVGIGVRPVTDWLAGSGLTIDDGVVCDETCLAAPNVVAAGDIARWPNRRFGEVMRVEHWDNALQQAEAAARTLLGAAKPFEPVPWFWSDQYDRKMQLAGRAAPTDDVRIVDGSLEERRFVALFGRGGRLVGAFGMNRPRQVMEHRQRILDGAPWDEST